MRNTLKDHMFSAVAPATDIAQQVQHVRSVPKAEKLCTVILTGWVGRSD
jgi:hypothetical protein